MERREFIGALAATPGLPAALTATNDDAAQAAAASKPLTVTLLGTGTPAPSLQRQSSGYLIEIGADLIVWDHGPGAHHRLIESGHRTIDVTHAFFTHLHYDHCMDYGRLVLQRWDQGAGRIPDLIELGKDRRLMFRGDADAAVADFDPHHLAVAPGRYQDATAGRGVAQGIGDQVGYHPFDHHRVR